MRTDPERISLDLIARKLDEVSDEELAALVGAERLVRCLKASGVETDGRCDVLPCRNDAPLSLCDADPSATCHCCPEHRCGA